MNGDLKSIQLVKSWPLYRENEIHKHHQDERAHLYHSFDPGTIEFEFGHMLTSMVLSWKPTHILETGTHTGVSTLYLAEGCRINGFGEIVSLEMNPDYAAVGKKNLASSPCVNIVCAESTSWLEHYSGPQFQIAVLDSDLRYRIREMEILRDRNLLNGLAFVHDSSRLRAAGGATDWPEFPKALDELGIPFIECPFSRGWRIFQFGGRK